MEKKLKLKKEIKTILILIILMILTLCFIDVADARRQEIENNQDAYKTRAVNVQIIR